MNAPPQDGKGGGKKGKGKGGEPAFHAYALIEINKEVDQITPRLQKNEQGQQGVAHNATGAVPPAVEEEKQEMLVPDGNFELDLSALNGDLDNGTGMGPLSNAPDGSKMAAAAAKQKRDQVEYASPTNVGGASGSKRSLSKKMKVKLPTIGRPVLHYNLHIRQLAMGSVAPGADPLSAGLGKGAGKKMGTMLSAREDILENTGRCQRFNLYLGPCDSVYEVAVGCSNHAGMSGDMFQLRVVVPPADEVEKDHARRTQNLLKRQSEVEALRRSRAGSSSLSPQNKQLAQGEGQQTPLGLGQQQGVGGNAADMLANMTLLDERNETGGNTTPPHAGTLLNTSAMLNTTPQSHKQKNKPTQN